MPFELVYGPAGGSPDPSLERTPISSAEELERELDRLEQRGLEGQPFIVELVEPTAGSLGIGLGGDQSVAAFNGADGEPPYYVSAGNGSGQASSSSSTRGNWTEFGAESAIPTERARAAMTASFRAASCPTTSPGRRPEPTWRSAACP